MIIAKSYETQTNHKNEIKKGNVYDSDFLDLSFANHKSDSFLTQFWVYEKDYKPMGEGFNCLTLTSAILT